MVNVNQQNAGTINNVDGNQHIYGGQYGVLAGELQRAVSDLRRALDSTPLPPEVARQARAHVDEVEQAVVKPEPDQQRAGSALERLTRLLTTVGPLATATTALVPALQTLGRLLGPVGAAALRMLPGL
jgi:hypothetical protein